MIELERVFRVRAESASNAKSLIELSLRSTLSIRSRDSLTLKMKLLVPRPLGSSTHSLV